MTKFLLIKSEDSTFISTKKNFTEDLKTKLLAEISADESAIFEDYFDVEIIKDSYIYLNTEIKVR
jgi:hypothetical protein